MNFGWYASFLCCCHSVWLKILCSSDFHTKFVALLQLFPHIKFVISRVHCSFCLHTNFLSFILTHKKEEHLEIVAHNACFYSTRQNFILAFVYIFGMHQQRHTVPVCANANWMWPLSNLERFMFFCMSLQKASNIFSIRWTIIFFSTLLQLSCVFSFGLKGKQ